MTTPVAVIPVGPLPAADAPARSVRMYSDANLVKRAVRNARPSKIGDAPRWVAVMDTFALGSTFANELCDLHDLDPDETVRGPYCQACDEAQDEDEGA